MTTKTYFYSSTLEVTSCGSCGIPFAIPDDLARSRHEDGRSFYCPNGHFIGWAASNEKTRLERQLRYANEAVAAQSARADQAEASRRAWKGQTTKLRNRVTNGQCPFCGKTLIALDVHIARVHPDEKPRDLTEADATA